MVIPSGNTSQQFMHIVLRKPPYPTFNRNPRPTSSSSLPCRMPLKSNSPFNPGASPLTGALGLAIFLLFSCPALDGNVGNILVSLGLGFSSKYGCSSIAFAVGLLAGLRDNRLFSRFAPAFVRVGNLERSTLPWEAADIDDGRRSDRALGKRLKSRHVDSVGIPQSSKVYIIRVIVNEA
jgi:hypothetical protein